MANAVYLELAREFDRMSAFCKNALVYARASSASEPDAWLPQLEKEVRALMGHLEQAEIQLSRVTQITQQLDVTAKQKQRDAALKFSEIRDALKRSLARVQEELS